MRTAKRLLPGLLTVALLLVPNVHAGRGGGDEVRLRAELIAPISAGDISGTADFRDRGRRQFSVEIEGLLPGERYDVTIAGEIVGTVVVNEFGIGELGFDDTAGPADVDVPFPANFPQLDGGESVAVGPLSGTLQSK